MTLPATSTLNQVPSSNTITAAFVLTRPVQRTASLLPSMEFQLVHQLLIGTKSMHSPSFSEDDPPALSDYSYGIAEVA